MIPSPTDKKCVRVGALVALLSLIADQLSKWFFMEVMRLPERSIEVLPFFKLVMVWNEGVSFGMFSDGGAARMWMLLAVAAVIVAVMLVWLWRAEKLYVSLALGLVIGGAIGNMIDRLHFGAVADFFYFHYGEWYWPAFNIADSTIFIGVVLLCWESIVNPSESKDRE